MDFEKELEKQNVLFYYFYFLEYEHLKNTCKSKENSIIHVSIILF